MLAIAALRTHASMRAFAATLLAHLADAHCPATSGYALTANATSERTAALVIRGDAFRDCGHGHRCAAENPLPTLAAARSHVTHVIVPLQAAGYAVDVYIATYECPGRDVRAWIGIYGPHAVVDAVAAARTAIETQGYTLRRALRLIGAPVDYIVVVRPDILFVANIFPAAVWQSNALVFFHSDQGGGNIYRGFDAPRRAEAVADKVHVLRGTGAACFVDAIENDNCFNSAFDDDDDGSYENGEGCYTPISQRIGAARVAFLRDLIPGTLIGTFGDNSGGDSIYRVVPRALEGLGAADRAALLGVAEDKLGAYAKGACHRKSRRWVVDGDARREELRL